MPIRSRIRWIMGQIELELRKLFALEFAKMAESDFVYTLASTNVDQISTTHDHSIYDNEFLDEFHYGSNPTVTSGVIERVQLVI